MRGSSHRLVLSHKPFLPDPSLQALHHISRGNCSDSVIRRRMVVSPSAESVAELISFVRANSPFYRELWAHLPERLSDINSLPIVDSDAYSKANSIEGNKLLTGKLIDGSIYKTGGTTASPKAAYYSREELHRGTQMLAAGMVRGTGLVPGDRIANLFWNGDMYAAFLLQVLVLMEMHLANIHLPITGNLPPAEVVGSMRDFKATVILSNPSTILRTANHLVQCGQTLPDIRLILYTGERYHHDLRNLVRSAFPRAAVGAFMFSSVDGGLVGLPTYPPVFGGDDDINPTYVANTPTVIMEIVSEDGEVITETNRRGSIVVTDLMRRLQPVVRYPMGDLAEWIDYEARIFSVHGRDSEDVKLGQVLLDMQKLRQVVAKTLDDQAVDGFQVVARRKGGMNELLFRLSSCPEDPEGAARSLEENLVEAFPSWRESVDGGYLLPLTVEWVSIQDLQYNARTGKLRAIIDERFTK
jgi:phenylacetate-CoA ligase